jgi:hypothetical protein
MWKRSGAKSARVWFAPGSALQLRAALVAVVIVEIVAESLASDFEAQVLVATGGGRGFRQRLHQSHNTQPPASDNRSACTS